MTDQEGGNSSEINPDRQDATPASSKRGDWLSMGGVLAVQTQNAFNDHLVKMIIIALARPVGVGEDWFGDEITSLLSAIILVSFIIFSPVAGYLADRFSKRSVLNYCLYAQVAIFIWIALGIYYRSPVGIVSGFTLIAIQSVFLSPAKFGIGKELVGTKGVGLSASLLQMLTMLGILAGMGISGPWWDSLLASNIAEVKADGLTQEEASKEAAWPSALLPMIVVGGLSLIPLLLILMVRRTPAAHPDRPFRNEILWSQFTDLAALLRPRNFRMAGLGVAFFWGMSTYISVIVVDIAYLLYEPKSPGGLTESSRMVVALSVGVVIGSLIASLTNRRGVELGIVPFGGIGMLVGVIWTGFSEPGTYGLYSALGLIGMSGAMFMVPLHGYLQDNADPKNRGQIMAATNILDCVAGIAAVGVFQLIKSAGVGPLDQFLYIAAPTGLVTVVTLVILRGYLIRFIALSIFRIIYRIKPINEDRVPREGGVLLVANHMTFVDSLVIQAACRRPVRYVIYDHYYNVWYMRPIFKVLGCVPISQTRAKDAIRTTAEAVKKGDVVCIFPEGQLTRHGIMNEVKKGFELIARKAGCPVVPAFMDSLWGSVFSYESDRVFKKRPHRIPYRVQVNFGEPLDPKSTTADDLRVALLELGEEAFGTREEITGGLPRSVTYSLAGGGRKVAVIDARIRPRSTRRRAILAVARNLAKVWEKDFDGHERVGVLLANSGAATIIHTGLVLAGKVPVNLPFDPGEDPADLARVLEEEGIKSVITADALKESIENYPWPEDTRGIGSEIAKSKDGLFWQSLKLSIVPRRFLLPERIDDPDKEAVGWISRDGDRFHLQTLSHRALVANSHQMTNINLFRKEDKVLTCTDTTSLAGVVAGLWQPILHGIPAVNLPLAAQAETLALFAESVGATVGVADSLERAKACAPVLRATYLITPIGREESLASAADIESGIFPLAIITEPPALVTASLPHPATRENTDPQHGWFEGSPGRLFPGLAIRQKENGLLQIKGAALGSDSWVSLPDDLVINIEGFLTLRDDSSK